MRITTGTDIICPECNREVDIETEGLLGGLIKQWFYQQVIERIKREDGGVTCGHCGHKWKLDGRG